MDMERITLDMLERKVTYLNKITGNPSEPYTKGDDGRSRANIGHYCLDGAYGGVALYQLESETGGVRSVFNVGHVPKRELYALICAYIAGIEAGKRGYGQKARHDPR